MNARGPSRPVVVGISGASGSILARETVDGLLDRDVSTVLVCTNDARLVWQEEMDESFGAALERWDESGNFTFFPSGDLRAPIASGTFPTLGMAMVPCSMSTMAAIAHGISDNLPRRAADVCLKEKRPLVLVPRETPLHAIHLDNMASLARMGVTILPPMPAFYLRPQTVEDIVEFVVQRLLWALGLVDSLPEDAQYTGPDARP